MVAYIYLPFSFYTRVNNEGIMDGIYILKNKAKIISEEIKQNTKNTLSDIEIQANPHLSAIFQNR